MCPIERGPSPIPRPHPSLRATWASPLLFHLPWLPSAPAHRPSALLTSCNPSSSVRPPLPASAPTPVPALTSKDGETQAEAEDDHVSLQWQLSQWGRGQRVGEGHKAQGTGPKATGDMDDLQVVGVAGGGARRGQGPGGHNQAPPLAWLWLSPIGSGPGTELAGMQVDKGMQESEAGIRELTPTLYPEALTCSPLLVRVDFMRMKKERSWTLEGGPAVGLASGAESGERLWGPEEKPTGHPCPLQS